MSDSNELRVKWFGCHLIWDSSDFGCQLIWDPNDLVVNRCVLQMIWLSIDVCSNWFWLSVDLNSKWCGSQLIWDSSDSVVNWSEIQIIWLSTDLRFSSELVVNGFEIQVVWLSIDVWFDWFCLSVDLRFKWFGCQLIWDSSDLDVKWFEVQVIWLSTDVWFKWFCQTKLFCETSSKKTVWSSKTNLFCETSFKIEVWKLKNEAFLRDFLQNRSFEDQERSFCARLPSKMKLWRSKTKLLCETSFKIEALRLKNEAFLRDFLQNWSFLKIKNEAFLRDFLQKWRTKLLCETSLKKWHFGDQKRSFSARLPSKMTCWLTGHLTAEFQYVLTFFKWTLQKYCACHEKVEPRHTATRNDHCKVTLPWHEICNPSTDSASEASNIDITKREITAPATRNASFRSFFKSTTPANVFATLTKSCACHVFCNVSKSLRLPRENHFEPQKTSRDRQFLTILASESLSRAGVVQILRSSTSKSAPNPRCFNDFDFKIALARRRVANFGKLSFQKCSRHASF